MDEAARRNEAITKLDSNLVTFEVRENNDYREPRRRERDVCRAGILDDLGPHLADVVEGALHDTGDVSVIVAPRRRRVHRRPSSRLRELVNVAAGLDERPQ